MKNTAPSDDLGTRAIEAGLRNAGPVEVWLSQANLQVRCSVVYEDESTSELDVDSLSMRGAQREITGHLVGHGYEPDGRWVTALVDKGDPVETYRRFRPSKST